MRKGLTPDSPTLPRSHASTLPRLVNPRSHNCASETRSTQAHFPHCYGLSHKRRYSHDYVTDFPIVSARVFQKTVRLEPPSARHEKQSSFDSGWQRQAESSELADGFSAHAQNHRQSEYGAPKRDSSRLGPLAAATRKKACEIRHRIPAAPRMRPPCDGACKLAGRAYTDGLWQRNPHLTPRVSL